MARKYKYVSLDRIFSKVIRDFGEDFSEGDIVEWAGEALEFIGAIQDYEEAVAYVEVKNHQCELPSGLHSIIQIARNNDWRGPKDDQFCPQIIKEDMCKPGDEDCQCNADPNAAPDFIVLDCNGQPLNDYDIAYYRPYFDLRYEYYNWRNSSVYRTKYSPVRLSTNSFFNSLVCTTEEEQNGSYDNDQDEYTIIRGETARFSFKEGSVAIAYTRQVLDSETGYPMVPDDISYTTAITMYITMKILSKDCYKGREGACGRADRATADWHWYCQQAGNKAKMPYGIDEYQNMLEQRSYILPRNGRYYGFFGKLARPEGRRWNDPDFRNQKPRFYLGN